MAALDDPVTHFCLRAERAALARFGGGCLAPVGALCRPDGDAYELLTAIAPAEDAPVERTRERLSG